MTNLLDHGYFWNPLTKLYYRGGQIPQWLAQEPDFTFNIVSKQVGYSRGKNIIDQYNVEKYIKYIEYYRMLNNIYDTADEPSPGFDYPIRINHSQEFITSRRKLIHDKITQDFKLSSNFEELDNEPAILEPLFRYYDHYFFEDSVAIFLGTQSLEFKYSNKDSMIAGVCRKRGCSYKITISRRILAQTFNNNEKFHLAGKVQCLDRLYCLQLIFEHELCHLIMFLKNFPPEGIYDGHGVMFKQLLFAYFRQTDIFHALLSGEITANTKNDFKRGDNVEFLYERERFSGFINKLGPDYAEVNAGLYIFSIPYAYLSKTTN